MRSAFRSTLLASVLVLAGLGCNQKTQVAQPPGETGSDVAAKSSGYSVYANDDKGYRFAYPSGATVTDRTDDRGTAHAFTSGENTYIVTFAEYPDNIPYADWAAVPPDEVDVVFLENREVFREYGRAHAEAFYALYDPAVSISVTKYDGLGAGAPVSADGDATFIRLLETLTFLGEPIFNQ